MSDTTAPAESPSPTPEDPRASNKAAVFDALSATGITSVLVEFNGSDDEGAMEIAEAKIGITAVDLPEQEVEIAVCAFSSEPYRKRVLLAEAIILIASDALYPLHPGWENNEGACGDFTLEVSDRTITLQFNARFIDYDHHEYVL